MRRLSPQKLLAAVAVIAGSTALFAQRASAAPAAAKGGAATCRASLAKVTAELAAARADATAAHKEVKRLRDAEAKRQKELEKQLGSPVIDQLH